MNSTESHVRLQNVSVLASGIAAAIFLLFALVPVSASAASAEELQGAQNLKSLQDGKRSCASLSTSDFQRIGEYVVGRMLGSSVSHEAMDNQMRSMAGSGSESQAHVFMGQRFAGCKTGRTPAAFGSMMGMMGAGMMGAAYSSGASTINGSVQNGGVNMMGNSDANNSNYRNDGWMGGNNGWMDGSSAAMFLFMALAIAIGAAVFFILFGSATRRSSDGTPDAILRQKLADGSLSVEEFHQRRTALDESKK